MGFLRCLVDLVLFYCGCNSLTKCLTDVTDLSILRMDGLKKRFVDTTFDSSQNLYLYESTGQLFKGKYLDFCGLSG